MNTVCSAAISLLLLAAPAFAQTSQPTTGPAGDALAPLSWLVGEWHLDGKWANGDPIRIWATYGLTSGGKFLSAWSRVHSAGGDWVDRDLAVYGIQDGRVTQWTFAQDGTVRIVPASLAEDGSLLFEWVKPGVTGKPDLPLRLRISRDGDALRWQQFTQLKGQWHATLDGRFVRMSTEIELHERDTVRVRPATTRPAE